MHIIHKHCMHQSDPALIAVMISLLQCGQLICTGLGPKNTSIVDGAETLYPVNIV